MPHDLLAFQRGFQAAIDSPVAGAMAVYRNGVIAGAAEALRSNYPVVAAILGGEMFGAVAVDHASDCPPRKPVLALYGARFADWLAEQGWAGDLPYLADVARIERLRTEALFAADCRPLEPAMLADDWRGQPLTLHPALRFGWFASPAMSVWTAHLQAIDSELEIEWAHEGALVTRPQLGVHTLPLDRASHRFLFGLRIGESPADSAASACRLYPATDMAALIDNLVNAGAFAAPFRERNPS